MNKKIILLIIVNLTFVLSGCSNINNSGPFPQSSAPEFIFRYAENQAPDYPTTLGAYHFADLVRERTNGRIEIVVYPSAELGTETKVLEQMGFGGIDFARVSLSQLAELSPSYNVLQLPYIYRDDSHMWQTLNSEIGDYYLKLVEDIGLVGLSWYDAGARSLYTRIPIRDLKDLHGLNIRVQESAMMSDMITLLGAKPVRLSFEEVYSGLQTGKLDGAENNFPSYESTSHFEVAKYFYVDEHTRIPEIQLMSKVTMEKLSEEDLIIIKDCAEESALFQREEWSRRELLSEKRIQDYGVEIIVPSVEEKLELQNICMPIYEKYASEYMDIVEQILAM